VTAEHYTVVFTGFLTAKEPGEYLYLSMSEEPSEPGGGSSFCRGRPPYERMGREISLDDFLGGVPVAGPGRLPEAVGLVTTKRFISGNIRSNLAQERIA
jgi:hypothetical protein